MARRVLNALAAAAVVGGSLFVSAAPAFADYPNITPGGGSAGTGGGGATSLTGGGGATSSAGGGGATSFTGGTGTTSGSLPFTGAEVLPLLGVGAALLVTGTTVLVAGRRRRPSGSAA